ncbi:MAG: hypothetical protein Q7J34_08190 [Bacteroidales bacterium]|jgi:hypothetical protein|nr:hypothetical protein [Bacteroidales bacterium]
MKAFIRYSLILTIISSIIFVSCTQDDVQRPVTQYTVKYQLSSKMDTTSGFYLTYFNPKYANLVSEYFADIKSWTYEFKGKTFDHLYLEAYSVHDSSRFDISIYVNGQSVVTAMDSCPWPIKCDTNRVSVKYTLQ